MKVSKCNLVRYTQDKGLLKYAWVCFVDCLNQIRASEKDGDQVGDIGDSWPSLLPKHVRYTITHGSISSQRNSETSEGVPYIRQLWKYYNQNR